MHDAARQLDSVARTSRLLLLVQRLAVFLVVVLGVFVALAAVDYVLRLPGWLRLIVVVGLAGLAAWWLAVHVSRAWRFRPAMSDLALRAERMYPQLAGSLASAVEFHEHNDLYADPHRTGTLAATAVARTQDRLAGVDLRKLVDPAPTLRLAVVMLACLVVAVGIATAAGDATGTAAARWLLPLGATQWPRWTLVADVGDEAGVRPVDEPVRLRAMVQRGHRSGMRVAAEYQIVDAEGRGIGPWQRALLNAQPATAAGHPYEVMLEVPAEVAQSLRSGQTTAAGVDYRLTAGDDATPPRRLTLVARPGVTTARAVIAPPTYARGLRSERPVNLLDGVGDVAGADGLAGSRVTLELAFNKPVPLNASVAASVLPGLAQVEGVRAEPVMAKGASAGMASGVRLTFPLMEAVETGVALVDEHGLTATVDRRFRFEPVEDRPPSVAVIDPRADTSVTARAAVPVEAVASDDVGVEQVGVEAVHPLREASRAEDTVGTTQVASVSDRKESLQAGAVLDLATLPLRPGDTVELYAIARDVFELNGREHDPVRSAPRVLRIIGDDQLIAEVRRDLTTVRDAAQRLEGQQNDLRDADDKRSEAELESHQGAITRRIAAQEQVASELKAKVEQNRVDDPTLKQTLDDAGKLLREAREASDAAQQAMQQAGEAADQAEREQQDDAAKQANQQAAAAAKERATQQQAAASQKLGELADRLGAGSEAWELEGKAQDLLNRQKDLEDKASELLPKTAGQRPEDLKPEDREALDNVADRQRQLADEARELVRDMKEAADRMKGSPSDAERAAGEAMKEASETAEREDLEDKMREASESAKENQLSQAQSQQSQASAALEQMVSQMGSQQREQQRQEMLKRRLVELAQLLEALLKEQKASLASTQAAVGEDAIKPLAPGQNALRQRTMAAEESAKAAREGGGAEAADTVGEAVADQATAVVSLREADKATAAPAQEAAVAHLADALATVQKKQQEQQTDEANQKRQELQKQYAQLAKRQDALREEVEGLISGGPLTRLARAKLRPIGESQETLRSEAEILGQESKDTLVFQQMHRRIDAAAARAANELKGGEADVSLAIDQRQVAATLRAMAAALEEAQSDQEFENPPESPQQGDQGGGGGGQPPPLVPPVAELKLLRQVQELVYLATRELHDASAVDPGGPTPAQAERTADLGKQQRELHDLGRQMIDKMQQNGPPQ